MQFVKYTKAFNDSRTLSLKLTDLKGIKELEQLFFYDNSKTMSPQFKKLYQQRLDLFYKLYTGKSNKRPSNIDSFDKISLLDFDKESKYCKGKSKKLFSEMPKIDDSFYKLYTKNLIALNKSLDKRKKNLLKILDYIFIKDKSTNKFKINEKLDEILLYKLTILTIDNVSRIYLNIQHYFFQGLLIFEKNV